MGFDCELAVVTGFKVGDEGDAKVIICWLRGGGDDDLDDDIDVNGELFDDATVVVVEGALSVGWHYEYRSIVYDYAR